MLMHIQSILSESEQNKKEYVLIIPQWRCCCVPAEYIQKKKHSKRLANLNIEIKNMAYPINVQIFLKKTISLNISR